MAEVTGFTVPETGQTYVIVPDPPGGFLVRDTADGSDLGRFGVVTGEARGVTNLSSGRIDGDRLDDAILGVIAEAFAKSRS